jgi:hypothetical protein
MSKDARFNWWWFGSAFVCCGTYLIAKDYGVVGAIMLFPGIVMQYQSIKREEDKP